jgi:spore cortex biosynthesis protein YabQ
MLMPVGTQLNVLFYSIMAGLVTAMLFDIYRVILYSDKQHNNIATLFSDLIFWILSAFLIFIFLLNTNYAYIKVYVYLYILLGAAIYFKFISSIFLYIQHMLLKYSIKIFRVLIKNILYPFQLMKFYFIIKILRNNKK